MTGETTTFAAPTQRRRGWTWAVALAIAFALGILATFWAGPTIERWRGVKRPSTSAQPIIVTPLATPPGSVAPITIEGLAAREAVLDLQLRSIEGRMATADAASRVSASHALRAERLMIAFAVRRRLDRGQPLENYETQLRTRFGAGADAAVSQIIAAGRAPVTVEDLREALDTIAPKLTSGTMADGVGTAVWRELRSLIVLRHESTPSPRATDRLARARRLLDAGQVEAALAEVARMPGASAAKSWMDAASRWIETRRALNTLETVALGPPTPPPTLPSDAPEGPKDALPAHHTADQPAGI
jgi:hypothetical protein